MVQVGLTWAGVLVAMTAWAAPAALASPGDAAPFIHFAVHDDKSHDNDRRDRALSKEEVAEALAILERVDPPAAKKLRADAEEHPERVQKELRQRIPHLEWFFKLKKWDQEMFDLRVEDLRLAHESAKLARQIRKAEAQDDAPASDQPDPDDLRDRLDTLLGEHFTIRQQIRERELAHLERRIEQLREELEQREDDRDELIEQRLAELIRKEDAGEW